ncbi:MAG: CoA-binding protein [Candidatus Helarchaeota archaeon]
MIQDKWNSNDLEKFHEIDYFFHPKSISLIGAGKVNPLTVSNIILSNILAEGYTGSLYLVDVLPQQDKIQGLRVYKSLFKVPEEIDLGLIIVPAAVVPSVIEDCIDANLKALIIITAGFSESLLYDKIGIKLQQQIDKLVKKSKVRIVGPNCNGVYSQDCSLNATLGPRILLPPGNFSLVTRGGTAGIILSVAAMKQNLGINKYIGVGDESDLLLQDFLQYFEYDNSTKVMGAYSEGIKNYKSFNDAMKKIQKPIVIYKSGETQSGARAATSHVGAIAGQFTSKIAEGLLKQLKIVKATSVEDLIDFVSATLITPLPKGNRVAIWTPGGSMGVIMSDHLEREGLLIPKLTEEQLKRLNRFLTVKYWSHNNPVDVTDSYNPQAIDKAAKVLLEGDNFNGLIILFGFGIMERMECVEFSFAREYEEMLQSFIKQQAKRFGRLIQKYQKPIFILANEQGETAKIFRKQGVIVLPTFRRIARTFRMLYQQYLYTIK